MAPTIFSPAALDKIVADTLPTELPPGHRHAVVMGFDKEGLSVVASFGLDHKGHWKFRGAFEHEWDGDNSIGAKLVGTF